MSKNTNNDWENFTGQIWIASYVYYYCLPDYNMAICRHSKVSCCVIHDYYNSHQSSLHGLDHGNSRQQCNPTNIWNSANTHGPYIIQSDSVLLSSYIPAHQKPIIRTVYTVYTYYLYDSPASHLNLKNMYITFWILNGNY